jgi:hypothetical protein
MIAKFTNTEMRYGINSGVDENFTDQVAIITEIASNKDMLVASWLDPEFEMYSMVLYLFTKSHKNYQFESFNTSITGYNHFNKSAFIELTPRDIVKIRLSK